MEARSTVREKNKQVVSMLIYTSKRSFDKYVFLFFFKHTNITF